VAGWRQEPLIKRRRELNPNRYKGEAGMKRRVGLAVIADNSLKSAAPRPSPGP
jgi:hypothetical protein